jgi:Family of unknown function (DUF5681)
MAENTAEKQRRRGPGRPFQSGESGNPAGRPKGARNRATMVAELLLDNEAEALTRKAIEQALSGDGAALRLCIDRILPPRKERPTAFSMPKIETVSDAPSVMAALTSAIADGEITASEAAEIARLVDVFVRSIEASDLDKRLRAIEQAVAK